MYQLETTIRHQAGLAAMNRLDRVGLRRLSALRTIWRDRCHA
jgi:hypothetical protein